MSSWTFFSLIMQSHMAKPMINNNYAYWLPNEVKSNNLDSKHNYLKLSHNVTNKQQRNRKTWDFNHYTNWNSKLQKYVKLLTSDPDAIPKNQGTRILPITSHEALNQAFHNFHWSKQFSSRSPWFFIIFHYFFFILIYLWNFKRSLLF